MSNELEQAINRHVLLQATQAHLADALPGTLGMDKAHEAVRTAYRIVSRQAGKAAARVRELEQKGEMAPAEIEDPVKLVGVGP